MIAERGYGLSDLTNPDGRLRFAEVWLLWFVMPCQGKLEAGTSACVVRNEVRRQVGMQRNCAFSVRTTRRILTAAMRIRSKLRRMKYEFAKWLRGLIFLALV